MCPIYHGTLGGVGRLIRLVVFAAVGVALVVSANRLGVGWWVVIPVALLLEMAYLAARLATLPIAPKLDPVEDPELSQRASILCDQVSALGFTRLEPAHYRERDLIIAFQHASEPICVTVTQTPYRTTYDLVSAVDRGWLQSTDHRTHGGAPIEWGGWKQILPGMPIAQALGAHRAALALLAERGIAAQRIDDLIAALEVATHRERVELRAHPIRSAATMWWRMVSRRTPHLGPLAPSLPEARLRQPPSERP